MLIRPLTPLKLLMMKIIIMKQQKILEILAEGGSISVYKYDNTTRKDLPKSFFVWHTGEMGLEDDYYTTNSENNDLTDDEKTDFSLFWQKLLETYPVVYHLYLDYLHPDYKSYILKDLLRKTKYGELRINELPSLDSWLKHLGKGLNDFIDESNIY